MSVQSMRSTSAGTRSERLEKVSRVPPPPQLAPLLLPVLLLLLPPCSRRASATAAARAEAEGASC